MWVVGSQPVTEGRGFYSVTPVLRSVEIKLRLVSRFVARRNLISGNTLTTERWQRVLVSIPGGAFISVGNT